MIFNTMDSILYIDNSFEIKQYKLNDKFFIKLFDLKTKNEHILSVFDNSKDHEQMLAHITFSLHKQEKFIDLTLSLFTKKELNKLLKEERN
ncbi:hypothetical protein [Spiroplasma endosymbiont of Sarcophaga variegata]|uniref:hypothetical protein n=1 Tax=Spiroplasma endosymbiont of Sarcophaga variegata TaxID=3066304 RepID=UPI003AF723B6